MFPPIFQLVSASAAVKALIGTSPVRFYLFGEATQATPKPYAVWQMVYGSPENYLAQLPDIDNLGVQIDSYATTASGARAVTAAIRDALEPAAYVVNWRGEEKDVPTGLYRSSFDVEFWTPR